MAQAIRVNVKGSCGSEVLDITVRENQDVYAMTRDMVCMAICYATKCNAEDYRVFLIDAVYRARMDGRNIIEVESDDGKTYTVSLVTGTEDYLSDFNLVA